MTNGERLLARIGGMTLAAVVAAVEINLFDSQFAAGLIMGLGIAWTARL